jgi:hypothetical protein
MPRRVQSAGEVVVIGIPSEDVYQLRLAAPTN